MEGNIGNTAKSNTLTTAVEKVFFHSTHDHLGFIYGDRSDKKAAFKNGWLVVDKKDKDLLKYIKDNFVGRTDIDAIITEHTEASAAEFQAQQAKEAMVQPVITELSDEQKAALDNQSKFTTGAVNSVKGADSTKQ